MQKIYPELMVKALINEAFHSRRWVVGLFVAVNVSMLITGLLWPSSYTASTSLLIVEKNIIQPLMEKMAVATDVADRGRNAREVIFGRKIMDRILETEGWLKNHPTAAERELIIDSIKKRTVISPIGRNIIKIEYSDNDAERAFRTTQKFADFFMTEGIAAKSAESRAAFDFIDKQTQDYQDRLSRIEKEISSLRSSNLDARGGTGDPSSRLNELQTRIERLTDELRDAQIKGISLAQQVSGEAEVTTVLTREGQYRARIGELQSQLDALRLSYHDTHPDVVRVKQQIRDLTDAIGAERKRSENAKQLGQPASDDATTNNPVYQQLRRDLSQNKVIIDTLKARISDAQKQLQREIDRSKHMNSGDTRLTELTRDYQVNRDIYQDLLRRRENARVSMNLDREQEGLTFKIQEPATLPQSPKGLRYWHFLVGGIFLGILIPLGLIYARLQIDPRIRIGDAISKTHKLSLAAVIPHRWTPTEIEKLRGELKLLSLTVGATLGTSALFSMLRMFRIL